MTHVKGFSWFFFLVLFTGGGSVLTSARAADAPVLTVDQAVDIALENSLQRKLALGDVDIAGDRLARAISEFGPTLSLESGLYRYNEPPSLVQLKQGLVRLNNALSQVTLGQVAPAAMPDDSRTYYGYGVKVTQPLYTGNRLTSTKKLAQANRDSAREALSATDNDLTLAVKKAGARVNLENDLIGKYVERFVGAMLGKPFENEGEKIDLAFLAKHGFLK